MSLPIPGKCVSGELRAEDNGASRLTESLVVGVDWEADLATHVEGGCSKVERSVWEGIERCTRRNRTDRASGGHGSEEEGTSSLHCCGWWSAQERCVF